MTGLSTRNVGIMHAVIKFGMKPLCGNRNAIMATEIAKFRLESTPCRRCLAKLAQMDVRAARAKQVSA